jgi:Predicted metal-binding, possibly nucleic acid-binding protein
MLVRLSEISPSGSHYDIRKIEGLDDLPVVNLLEARCSLTRKGETKVELTGRLQSTVMLECDRCLSLYQLEMDVALQMLFEVETDASWQVKDLEYRIPDLDTIVLDAPVIDLDDVIRQQLYLALPVKSLCSDQCKGICSNCGANRNIVPCGCDDTCGKSPFAVLAQLKK